MTSSEVPFSPFEYEYAVMERHPDQPDKWRELFLTTDRDVAYGALAGLNMQFGMRERWTDPDLPPSVHGVGRFQVLARIRGSKWLHPEEVGSFVQTLLVALHEYDEKRGYPPNMYPHQK
jgi:hypothetical protein